MSSQILFASNSTALQIHGVAAPNPVVEGFEARAAMIGRLSHFSPIFSLNKVLVEIRVQLRFAAFQCISYLQDFNDFSDAKRW